MKVFISILLMLFIGVNVFSQYTVKRVYFDTNSATNDTLLIKDGTDSLFRLVEGQYIYAWKLKSKTLIIPSEIIGLNFKTINGSSILGNGDLVVGGGAVAWGDVTDKPLTFPSDAHTHTIANVTGLQAAIDGKQDVLGFTPLAANGNGSSLTGLTKTQVGLANVDNTSDANKPVSSATQAALDGKAATIHGHFIDDITDLQSTIDGKQATLVSGTNIKSVNGNSLLGSGDIPITSAVGWGNITGTLSNQADLVTALSLKANLASPTFTGTPVVPGYLQNTTTSGVAASPTASSTVTITHNLGRVPTTIRIESVSSFTSNAAATPVPFSRGTWNSTGNRCLYMVINGTTTQVSQTSTVFAIIMVTSNGNRIEGVIQNVGATTFDIVFTETGTHTAGNYLWEAQ
jgi:hypothetical protein